VNNHNKKLVLNYRGKVIMTEVCEPGKKEFYKGDLAVYPAHGVGCIESIESKEINGENMNFYMMKIIENDSPGLQGHAEKGPGAR